MPRKAFQLQVELEIQAITCPGVWLCPNGKISLQLYMLDSCIQTTSLSPIFPLLYHEKFIFYKIFYKAQQLRELQKLLSKEILYAELIQWQNCEIGNVLATFETTLAELLYPTIREGAIAGVDIDLLMEPERHFPGIIAPKIEVNTKTTIEEKHFRDGSKISNAFVVNPKVITSSGPEKSPPHKRQRKVCHSTGYHRRKHSRRKYDKPPFIVRKVEDDLLARKPQGLNHNSDPCHCMKRSKSLGKLNSDDESDYSGVVVVPKKQYLTSRRRTSNKQKTASPVCVCGCGHRHTQQNCPVCSKYRRYFNQDEEDSPERDQQQSIKEKILNICPKTEKMCCCAMLNEDDDPSCPPILMPRICNCGGNCNKLCFCQPHRRTSIAGKIHERLNKTLGSCIDTDLSTIYEQSCPPPIECQCGNCSSNDVFENFDKFYRNLYRSANCRSGESTNRYVTSC